MKSYKNGTVNYKSSLELKAMRYADYNKHIVKWSLEPFSIKYVKPMDGKVHRYYIDFFFEFSTGQKFLVEIKSKGETKPPRLPRNNSAKSQSNYQRALMTYSTNTAKWKAAKEFCAQNNTQFIILTEKELNF